MKLDSLLQQTTRARVSNLSVIPTSTRFIAALAALAMSFTMPVSAGQLGDCAAEYTSGQGGLNCTAADDGGTVEAINTPSFCVIGQGLTFDVQTSFENNTQAARYDARYWVAIDGGDVRETADNGGPAECSASALTIGVPIEVTDEESNGDTCGDIAGGSNFPPTNIDTVTLDCIPNANGLVQFNTAVTWHTRATDDCRVDALRGPVGPDISKSQAACVETTLGSESLGRVTVIKSAPEDDGSTDFVFNWSSSSPPQDPANQNLNPADPFFLADGGNQGILYALVTSGGSAVVTVTEQDPSGLGYTLESIDCPGASVNPIQNGVEVTLTYDVNNPGLADVTCTFNNVAVQTNPGMSVFKTSTTGAIVGPGDVTYDYVVTNLGNVDLTNVGLVDDNVNGDVSCPQNFVVVGDTMNCSATHTVTQVEFDSNGSPTPGSGMLSNVVTASSAETANRTDNLDIPITQILLLTVVKSSPTSSIGAPQDVLYSYLVTNDGNTTLTDINLVDDNITSAMLCEDNSLAPGDSFTCMATKTVTQGDVDNNGSPVANSGELLNNVTATSAEGAEDTDSLSIPFVTGPAISVLKSSTTTGIISAGVVDYSYFVVNTGDVTLTGVRIDDDNDEDDASCTVTTLAPGANTTCSATHNVTPGEITDGGSPVAGSGFLVNNATAFGSSPDNTDDVSDTDSLSIPFVLGAAGISVVKSSTTTEIISAGEVDYRYFVVNTGDEILTGVRIDDDNVEVEAICTDIILPVGGDTICVATHNVTPGEITDGGSPVAGSGFLVNNATAFGSSPDNTDDVSDTDSLSIPFVDRVGRFTVVKDFSDDNPGTVDVAIICNSGLPLQQEFTISEGHQVTFTVAGYIADATTCVITEVVPDGYTPDYSNGDVNSAVSCVYEDIPAGATFACLIYNELDPVTVIVNKEWTGVTVNDGIDLFAHADYECINVREAADSDSLTSVNGSLNFEGELDSEVISDLYPDYGGSSICSVTELQLNSAAEGDDSECASLPISLGQGNSCTIHNTVFFEGIPTLNQYGLMLLALLMLAVGAIGFRRHM